MQILDPQEILIFLAVVAEDKAALAVLQRVGEIIELELRVEQVHHHNGIERSASELPV